MSRKNAKLVTILSLILLMLYPVCLVEAGVNGLIEINPKWPATQKSPADFEIWVKSSSADPTNDPYIFIAMTESCYLGLTGNVEVSWTGGSTSISSFTGPENTNSKKLPNSDIGYTVASLKVHLGTTEPIYWAFVSFLSGPITTTHTSFTVTFSSSTPKIVVYAFGKIGDSDEFDNRVPTTNPGFVVPEPATIVAVATSLIALIGYTTLKNKNLL